MMVHSRVGLIVPPCARSSRLPLLIAALLATAWRPAPLRAQAAADSAALLPSWPGIGLHGAAGFGGGSGAIWGAGADLQVVTVSARQRTGIRLHGFATDFASLGGGACLTFGGGACARRSAWIVGASAGLAVLDNVRNGVPRTTISVGPALMTVVDNGSTTGALFGADLGVEQVMSVRGRSALALIFESVVFLSSNDVAVVAMVGARVNTW